MIDYSGRPLGVETNKIFKAIVDMDCADEMVEGERFPAYLCTATDIKVVAKERFVCLD
jgi:hypothetical protein